MKLTYNGVTYVIPRGYRVCVHESTILPGRVRINAPRINTDKIDDNQLFLLAGARSHRHTDEFEDTLEYTLNYLETTNHV